jgi:hypothetical protein
VDRFCCLIISNGRPDNVKTIDSLRRGGYSGEVFIVCDDLDDTLDQYRERFGPSVVVFDKSEVSKRIDRLDNFTWLDCSVFARHAAYDVARLLGYRYFVMLDDDYSSFNFRFNGRLVWDSKEIPIKDLDSVFRHMFSFLVSTPTKTLAMAQSGDYVGGGSGSFASKIYLKRKAMNTFFCDTEKPVNWLGSMNEDVNTYVADSVTGGLYLTTNQVAIHQAPTQSTGGGLTDRYLSSGTYVKSFYSLIVHPSGVSLRAIGESHRRIHHHVNWNKTAPKIVAETVRKPRE